MKKCIFCKQEKEDGEFNKEHIILEALGGKGAEDILEDVCISCNSSLGSHVDAGLINLKVIEFMRFKYKIRGKNGVPNPFKGIKVEYDHTGIYGEFLTDKNGNICGFRADHAVYDLKDRKMIVGPRKNFHGFVNNQLKKQGEKELSETEINQGELSFVKKYPHIKYVSFPQEMKSSTMISAIPGLLKIAYEFCYIKLGDKYLDDSTAIEICQFLNEFDYRKTEEYFWPTDIKWEWDDLEKREVTVTIFSDNKNVIVEINLYQTIKCRIKMSTDCERYIIPKDNVLRMEV